MIEGRELEVSVLGNDQPRSSLPGEVISHSDFYDYEEKYLKETAELIIPASFPADVCEDIRSVAVRAFQAVDGSGFGAGGPLPHSGQPHRGKRDQHASRLHVDKHVPETVGSDRHILHGTYRPPRRTCIGTTQGQAEHPNG